MVTKAIIESVEDIYSVKVRMPTLDSIPEYAGATSVNELSDAIICTLPRSSYIPEVGDIVIVAFEDNDLGKPIILGCLFKETNNISQVNLEVNDLKVTSHVSLSKDIDIGDISYNELKYLIGLKQNIQSTIDNILERLNKIEENS